jgi:Protein of unknown function (DUF3489)
MPQLSDSLLVVLTAACQRSDRCVFPVTARLKGNAAGNVLKSLLNKGLIKEIRAKRDDTVWRHDEERGRMTLVATEAAFAALGIDPHDEDDDDEDTRTNKADNASADLEAESKRRSKAPRTKEPKTPRTRDGSKQAQLIAMLRRAKGATVDEIAEALSWQPHTVRGSGLPRYFAVSAWQLRLFIWCRLGPISASVRKLQRACCWR